MPQSLEPTLTANTILLILAVIGALFMARASTLYRRNIGDVPEQHRQKRIILRILVFLITVGLIGAAINLLFT